MGRHARRQQASSFTWGFSQLSARKSWQENLEHQHPTTNQQMSKRIRKWKFTFEEIDAFDARRGYKRCTLPGVGCAWEPDPVLGGRPIRATADLWRDKKGNVVIRFSSNQPWMFYC